MSKIVNLNFGSKNVDVLNLDVTLEELTQALKKVNETHTISKLVVGVVDKDDRTCFMFTANITPKDLQRIAIEAQTQAMAMFFGGSQP